MFYFKFKRFGILFMLLVFSTFSNAISINLLDIPRDEHKFYDWRGYPLLVFYRSSKEFLDTSTSKYEAEPRTIDSMVALSARRFGNEAATILLYTKLLREKYLHGFNDEIIVLLGVSISSGCKITVSDSYLIDPCSFERFDFEGKGLSSKTSMLLSPEYEINNGKLIIKETLDRESIIDFSPDTLNKDMNLGDKIIELINWNKPTAVEQLISENPEIINYKNLEGIGILHLLSGKGVLYVIDEKYVSSLDINALSDSGETPLSVAVKMRKENSIDWLINNGAYKGEVCDKNNCSKPFQELIKIYFSDYGSNQRGQSKGSELNKK